LPPIAAKCRGVCPLKVLTKKDFFVGMKIEFSIKHFCNIKLCCLWRFNDKISVIYCEIACVYILFYIYCFRGGHLFTWQQEGATQR
jgi:hypothetical protein